MRTPSKTASDFDSCRGGSPRHSFARRFVFAAALFVAVLVAPTATPAATKYAPAGQFPPPYPENVSWSPTYFSQLRNESVAVSDKNGHIYVADSGVGKVYDYQSTADQTPDEWTGSNTPAGSFGQQLSVAVDNTSGDVYVGDTAHGVILKFDEAGSLITSFGDSTPAADGQLMGLDTPDGSFSFSVGSFSGVAGIAVNQGTHDLYVIDAGHEVVDIFDEGGNYVRQITVTPEGLYGSSGSGANGIAVSAATGNVYLADESSHLIFQFDDAGAYVSTWNAADLPNGGDSTTPGGSFGNFILSLALRNSTGEVLVNSSAVDIFDEDGNYLPPSLEASYGNLSIDQDSGYLYVAPLFGGAIYVYSPTTVPDVAVDPASNLTFDSAVFRGHVDPAGAGNITDCHFEYVEEGLYRKPFSVSWEDATRVPCEANPPLGPPFTGPTDVSAQVSDLEPGHRYHLRLVATSASGTNIDVAPLLVTPGEYEFSRAIGSSGSGDGQFDEPQEVAFDDATGEIYVVDTGNHRVVKLDASGDFVAAWGWGVSDGTAASQVCNGGCEGGTAGTGPGQFDAPRYIEVDNSPGESAHAVYVGDAAHGTVQKFTPSGDLIQAWGEGGEVDFSDEGEIKGITVSPVGDLFVATTDPPYMWTQLNAGGLFRLQIPTEFTGLGRPGGGGIDVDPFGGFFQAQPAENEGSGGVYHRNLSNRVESNHSIYPPGYNSILKNTGLAVDREVSDVYVAQGTYIDQFKPHTGCFLGAIAAVQPVNLCPPDDTFGYGDLVDAAGLAFDPASKRLYAADRGADRIAVFERIPTPRTTTGPPLDEGSPTEVSGHVEPAPGDLITGCRVEYGKTSDYELGDVPCAPGGQLSGPTDVNAVFAGLDPLSTYHYRVVAEGSNGFPSRGEDRTFTVQGPRPSVGSSSASDVGPTQATLHAAVNPESAPTVYRFEYGTSTDYESATPAGDSIGADASVHQVSSIVNGLQPGVTYHFRVVARNFNGPTFGSDQTFRTPSVQSSDGGVPSSGSPTPNPLTSAPKAKNKKSCKRGYVRKKGKCRKRKRGGRR